MSIYLQSFLVWLIISDVGFRVTTNREALIISWLYFHHIIKKAMIKIVRTAMKSLYSSICLANGRCTCASYRWGCFETIGWKKCFHDVHWWAWNDCHRRQRLKINFDSQKASPLFRFLWLSRIVRSQMKKLKFLWYANALNFDFLNNRCSTINVSYIFINRYVL